jgi:hypothetical protein
MSKKKCLERINKYLFTCDLSGEKLNPKRIQEVTNGP